MSAAGPWHFVTFYNPGTLVAEETRMPIARWDADAAVRLARGIKERHGATPYGFRFQTRAREAEDMDSKIVATSSMYWLGGKIETLEQIEARNLPGERILLSNMRGNGWNPSAEAVLTRLAAERAEPVRIPYRATPFDSVMLGLCAAAALGLVTVPVWSLLA